MVDVHLSVWLPSGDLVAEVSVRPDCDFALHTGEPPGFVEGTFTRGPAFPTIAAMLHRFNTVFESGTIADASAVHDLIDDVGMVATDAGGNVFKVSAVYFQEGGLLFSACRQPPNKVLEQSKASPRDR